MIASDLVRLGVFGALPFAPNALVIVVLALWRGSPPGSSARPSTPGMPNLVSERDLPQANALFQSVENLTWPVGPLARRR